MNSNHYCVIMAGGIGSRFWPYSRKAMPKQFIDFFGTGQSLLQQTFHRYHQLFDTDHIFVTTNIDYKDLIAQQLPQVDEKHVLFETSRRNTASSIARACNHIRLIDPNACTVIAPCDHLIFDEASFFESIRKGLVFVESNAVLLTLGLKPMRPDTGYGYIQVDENKGGDFYTAKTFVEKPQLEFAKVFVESGEFYWNSGIFLWNVNTILDAFKHIMPEMYAHIDDSDLEYDTCPNISIDYAIMEKADNVYVQLCNFGWADLGSWNALYDATHKDENRNADTTRRALTYDAEGNLIALPKEDMAIVQDVHNMIISYRDGVLLICPRDKADQIRNHMNDIRVKHGEKYM